MKKRFYRKELKKIKLLLINAKNLIYIPGQNIDKLNIKPIGKSVDIIYYLDCIYETK